MVVLASGLSASVLHVEDRWVPPLRFKRTGPLQDAVVVNAILALIVAHVIVAVAPRILLVTWIAAPCFAVIFVIPTLYFLVVTVY